MAFRRRRTTRKIGRRPRLRLRRKVRTSRRRKTYRRSTRRTRRRVSKPEWKYFRCTLNNGFVASLGSSGGQPSPNFPVFAATLPYPENGISHTMRIGRSIGRMGVSVGGVMTLNPGIWTGNGTPSIAPTNAMIRIIWYQIKSGNNIFNASNGNFSDYTNGCNTLATTEYVEQVAATQQHPLFTSLTSPGPIRLWANIPNPTDVPHLTTTGTNDFIALATAPVQNLLYGPLRRGCTEQIRILDDRIVNLNSNSVAMKKVSYRFTPNRYRWNENVTNDLTQEAFYEQPTNPIMMQALCLFNYYDVGNAASPVHVIERPTVTFNLKVQMYFQDA